jgi:hypothetical protein
MVYQIHTNSKVWNKNIRYQLPKSKDTLVNWYMKKIIQVMGL